MQAYDRLRRMTQDWNEISPTGYDRDTAARLLRVHVLRAADALQLAAALLACNNRTETLALATFDDRLADAARREGFAVLSE